MPYQPRWTRITVCLFWWLSLWNMSEVQGLTHQHLDSAEKIYSGKGCLRYTIESIVFSGNDKESLALFLLRRR